MPDVRLGFGIGVAVASALIAGCTQSPLSEHSAPHASSSTSTSTAGVSMNVGDAQLTGTMHVAEPPADDRTLFLPIVRAGRMATCPNQTGPAQTGTRHHTLYVVVDCGDRGVRAVKVVYTSTTVPHLIGTDAHGPLALGGLLQLHFEERYVQRNGPQSNVVLRQQPAAGNVVPRGSTVSVVVTR